MASLQTSFQTTPNSTYLGIAPEMSNQTLFYGIPKKVHAKTRRPVFKKKLPKSTSKRRIIKKQRQKKLNLWLKIKKDISYFEEQHETLVNYIERDYFEYEQCCKTYCEENKYYDPHFDIDEVYTKKNFHEDIDYLRSNIMKHVKFHKILREEASKKGIFIEQIPCDIIDDLSHMLVYDY